MHFHAPGFHQNSGILTYADLSNFHKLTAEQVVLVL